MPLPTVVSPTDQSVPELTDATSSTQPAAPTVTPPPAPEPKFATATLPGPAQTVTAPIIAAPLPLTAATDSSVNATSQEATQIQLQQMQGTTALGVANLNADTQTKLQQMQDDNKNLLQGNSAASAYWNQAVNAITTINTSPNMDAGAKQTAVNNILAQTQAGLADQSAILDLNIGANFSALTAGAGAAATETATATGTPVPAPRRWGTRSTLRSSRNFTGVGQFVAKCATVFFWNGSRIMGRSRRQH
ncbi:MAG TPA: hypothetical protein VMV91_14855 [Rhodocyclaceae bacterium]|nr:hypothetical protein [Rhodocyclaceae bacterium]